MWIMKRAWVFRSDVSAKIPYKMCIRDSAYSTITEMIDAAVDKGLKLLAITEHAPAMPGSCKDFYFYNLKILPRFQKGLEIMFGVEDVYKRQVLRRMQSIR